MRYKLLLLLVLINLISNVSGKGQGTKLTLRPPTPQHLLLERLITREAERRNLTFRRPSSSTSITADAGTPTSTRSTHTLRSFSPLQYNGTDRVEEEQGNIARTRRSRRVTPNPPASPPSSSHHGTK